MKNTIKIDSTKRGTEGVVFLGGYLSDMQGSKASFLAEWTKAQDISYTRFDYRGHGASSGNFADCTLSDWLEDSLQIIDEHTTDKQILIGSSMGGWLAVLAALHRPERVKALILLAPAIDMTRRLMWERYNPEQKKELTQNGILYEPSDYDEKGMLVTMKLIENGDQFLLLEKEIPLTMPISILHGAQDFVVPYSLSLEFMEKVKTQNVSLHLLKNGNHQLSDQEGLATLARLLEPHLR